MHCDIIYKMPPKVAKQVLFKIESPEAFLDLIQPEEKKLIVVDLHLAWCGACDCMESNFRAVFFDLDSAITRIAFYSASEENIPEEVMASLKHGPLNAKPRFAMWLVSLDLAFNPVTGRRKEGGDRRRRLHQNHDLHQQVRAYPRRLILQHLYA